jgi:glucosamine-6-phosphate deaminase
VTPEAELPARVAHLLLEQRLREPQRPLGLATGRTMEPVYSALAAAFAALPGPERERVRRQWLSFNLDEYVGLPPHDPRSFAAAMRLRLVEPLGLDPARVRLPRGDAADPAAEARRYAEELRGAGGLGLQLLGLGLNGHVAFNEPPCGPDATCRCQELSPLTREQNAAAFGGDPAAVPRLGITLGLAEILAADRLLLVVTGAAKAPVLRRALDSAPTPALPASWLQRHPALRVVADPAALGAPAGV